MFGNLRPLPMEDRRRLHVQKFAHHMLAASRFASFLQRMHGVVLESAPPPCVSHADEIRRLKRVLKRAM